MSNKLFNAEEFTFGRKGVLARLMAKFILWVFGTRKANEAYERLQHTDQSLEAITEELDVRVVVDDKSLSNIPAEGPTIIICNHPTGIIDGIIMLQAVTRIRQDVKFLGNFLLTRVEPITPYLIPVNPFEERKGGNLAGLKLGLKHVNEGGCLLLFPAGEVSTWQKGWRHIADKRWDSAAVKFIRKSGATVVPCWIDGRNSLTFRLLGKIHPRLRTAMLCHEMFNKRGVRMPITIGSPLSASRLKEIDDLETYHRYLRATVDYLEGCREKPVRSFEDILKDQGDMGDIIPAIDKEVLRAEVEGLAPERKIFDHGDHYSIYLAPSSEIPNMMQEIGRQREIAFRSIGEGSMKSVDIDQYDSYYHQLFIWDNEASALVGAYRIGFGGEIMERFGLDGFYTHSLFRYDKELSEMLRHSLELGRSFISPSYQRRPTSLLMLWKGIFHTLLTCDDYRYLIGPVTISGEFQRSSKTIIMTHLMQQHFNHQIAAHVHPRTGAEGIDAPIDASLIEKVESMSLVDKIVGDIEKDIRTTPVLVKKYLQLGSHVVGFNVDHDFCDALDALMLLDIEEVPEQKMQMLVKEVSEDVVAQRMSKSTRE
ncbi:MAG: lysophospholipid acyltransferase family protein [Tidjanibacter sp.]|nr:lysophospholipid acyltransferase family protein [Tidjanibacter sp.]